MTPSPGHLDRTDIARRGAIATVLAALTNAIVLAAVTTTAAVPPSQPLAYPPVVFLTVVGAVGATLTYAVIQSRSATPRRTFAIVAGVVLLLSFVPDLTYIPTLPGATTGTVVVLMAMHVTVAGITYAVLTR